MNHDDQARINDMIDELDERDPTQVQRVLDEIAKTLERRRHPQEIDEGETLHEEGIVRESRR